MSQELSVFKNDVIDWVIARDEADAQRVCAEHYETSVEDYDGGVWVRLPRESIVDVSGPDVTDGRTCGEWIATEGRGFLCSTEY